MLTWSRYNILLRNDNYDYYLLYNTISNVLFELDKVHYNQLSEIKKVGLNSLLINTSSKFYRALREYKVIVSGSENNFEIANNNHFRNELVLNKENLSLTICPTYGCNFTCSYCFEDSQLNSQIISNETILQIIKFIKSFKEIKTLTVYWYGGEPTLAFDRIIEITDQIKNLDIVYNEANIVTNGYLLTKNKISRLNELNIKNVQFTLDGYAEVHDKRRCLKGGHPTFERIISNIDNLLCSEYEGSCSIRVNIDKSNHKDFFVLKDFLLNRYSRSKITIYPGRIDNYNNKFDDSLMFTPKEWFDLSIEYFNKYNSAVENIFPIKNLHNVCSANSYNSYVIGYNGDLFKCWEDVGKIEMKIGNIYDEQYITNDKVNLQYLENTNPYSINSCLECIYLSICGGGCAKRILMNKSSLTPNNECCSIYKDFIRSVIFLYYENYISKEFIHSLSINKKLIKDDSGFRIVSP